MSRDRLLRLPGSESSLLLIESPACDWLGDGGKALVVVGQKYDGAFDHPEGKMHGRGMQLRIGSACDAVELFLDGPPDAMRIRKADERMMLLDITGGQRGVGTIVNLWGTTERPAWTVTYVLHADGTLGPRDAPRLCLGVVCQGKNRQQQPQGGVILVEVRRSLDRVAVARHTPRTQRKRAARA